MKTVVSYVYSNKYGDVSQAMKVFDFEINNVIKWNEMMYLLQEAHPEAKNSIVITFMKTLED
jgi:hypothetical protein